MLVPKGLKSLIDKLSKKDLVLIYNMGKVGSSTLTYSIPNALQVHTLYGKLPPQKTRYNNMSLMRNFKFFFVRKLTLMMLKRRRKTKIITIVRHPINRNRSMFFQDIELWLTKHNLEKNSNKNSYYLQPLVDAYLNTFDHLFYLSWFDNELKRLTKIDIRNVNFHRGIAIEKNESYEVLILKLENLNDNIQIISDFTKNKIDLKNNNISNKKWYGVSFNEFKKLTVFEVEKKILDSDICKILGYK